MNWLSNYMHYFMHRINIEYIKYITIEKNIFFAWLFNKSCLLYGVSCPKPEPVVRNSIVLETSRINENPPES